MRYIQPILRVYHQPNSIRYRGQTETCAQITIQSCARSRMYYNFIAIGMNFLFFSFFLYYNIFFISEMNIHYVLFHVVSILEHDSMPHTIPFVQMS